MKKITMTLLFAIVSAIANAQNVVQIKADPGTGAGTVIQNVQDGGVFNVSNTLAQLTTFDLTIAAIPAGHKYTITCSGVALAAGITADYTTAGTPKTFTFQGNIVNAQITVNDEPAAGGAQSKYVAFKFIQTANGIVPQGGTPGGAVVVLPPISSVLNPILSHLESSPYGLIDPTDKDKKVHIFFDQYGNSIAGTIPQGIANKQYVIHIIYPGYSNKAMDVAYSVKQKTGSFSSTLVYNNAGIIGQLGNKLQGNQVKNYDTWLVSSDPLGTATDDLTFDIVVTTVDDNGKPVKGVLETNTIKMSPVYHGTFDVGLINSTLNNPTYSLVTSPTNAVEKVVKETDAGRKGIVTIMATPYTSIPLLIEALFGKKVPAYKLYGRNFLDDHAFFERIYPTVGVSLSSKTFDNLFFGLNWELARGLSVFGGGHWGKVNTFDLSTPGYTQGVTAVSQAQFDYTQNTKWRVAWAYGVKLDILLVTNLFK